MIIFFYLFIASVVYFLAVGVIQFCFLRGMRMRQRLFISALSPLVVPVIAFVEFQRSGRFSTPWFFNSPPGHKDKDRARAKADHYKKKFAREHYIKLGSNRLPNRYWTNR